VRDVRRTIGLLVTVAAAAMLAGGCGGHSSGPPLTKAQYVVQVAKVRRGIVVSLGGLGSLSGATAAADALTKVQDDMRTAESRLKAINPPASISAEHDRLTTGVGDFADELDPVIGKLKQGDLGALSQIPNLHGFTEIQSALEAIGQAGYPIGS
jgi:hypothetical protein